jgi:hypothetical protein
MELQLFFHEFVQPWWYCALQNPDSLFPNTFKYIEDHVPEGMKIMKKNQVLEGIQAGYDEMLKMHERSLTYPIIYLILFDSSRAPPLLRVILQLIEDHDTQLQFNHEDGWVDLSSYRQNIISNDSPESIWFGLLDSEEQKVKLCHFFRQFGFHRECIRYYTRYFQILAQLKITETTKITCRIYKVNYQWTPQPARNESKDLRPPGRNSLSGGPLPFRLHVSGVGRGGSMVL